MDSLDDHLEARANADVLHPDECPDIECDGHMAYNEWTNTRDCTNCNYREDVAQIGERKELV